MRAVFIALTVLSIAAPALAGEAVPQPQQVTSTAQPLLQADPRNKVVCHSQIHEGSITPIKLCGTQQAWDRARMELQYRLSAIETRSR